MDRYLTVTVLAMTLIGFLLRYLGPIARQVGLVDKPSGRKQHSKEIPLVGGVALAITFFLAMLLMPFSLKDYRMLFFSLAALLIVGVLDDHRDVSAAIKLLMQVFIAVLLVLLGGILVTDIGDIFNRGVPQGLSFLAIPFSVVGIVGIINAFNMIDGHDGLAGLCAIVSLSALGLVCYESGMLNYVAVFLLLAGLTFIFVLFNLGLFGSNNQVFLGDAGSMFLGLIVAYYLIVLGGLPVPENFVGDQKLVIKITAAPWIVGLPLFDLFASIGRRLIGSRSIFIADRGHIHHRLADLGYSKTFTLIVLSVTHVILVSVGVVGTVLDLPDWLLFWPLFVILGCYLGLSHIHEKKLLSKSWDL